jgi:hypothetical protein
MYVYSDGGIDGRAAGAGGVAPAAADVWPRGLAVLHAGNPALGGERVREEKRREEREKGKREERESLVDWLCCMLETLLSVEREWERRRGEGERKVRAEKW